MNLKGEIERLQMQIAFQESAISDLNDVVTKQDEELRIIAKQLKFLSDSIKSEDEGDSVTTNEPPPHY